jgi:RNA polymerase sigma-70 factor (ECF subfamily)
MSAVAEASLAELARTARAAWPTLELRDEVFLAHLRERVPDPLPPDAAELIHAADLFLACACANGDPRAIAEFERGYIATLDGVVAQMRLGADLVDEVKQRVRDRLLVRVSDGAPRIADYSGRGALRSWVYATAMRTALNALAAAKRHLPTEQEQLLDIPTSGDDPEWAALRAHHRSEFAAAFGAAFTTLTARQRLLLKQHFVDGLSTEELGNQYRVHRVTVLRWICQARDELVTALQRALAAELGVDADEYKSLVRLVKSQLDLSLSQLLA